MYSWARMGCSDSFQDRLPADVFCPGVSGCTDRPQEYHTGSYVLIPPDIRPLPVLKSFPHNNAPPRQFAPIKKACPFAGTGLSFQKLKTDIGRASCRERV